MSREAVLLEETFTRTHENALYTVALLRRDGLRSAILVTMPLHLARARLAFAAAGLTVYPVRSSETDLSLSSQTPSSGSPSSKTLSTSMAAWRSTGSGVGYET